MQNYPGYQIANVKGDVLDKIKDFETQLKAQAGQEIVLIAYQSNLQ